MKPLTWAWLRKLVTQPAGTHMDRRGEVSQAGEVGQVRQAGRQAGRSAVGSQACETDQMYVKLIRCSLRL